MPDVNNTPASETQEQEKSDYLWDEKGDKIDEVDTPSPEVTASADESSSDADSKEADKKIRAESFKLASEFGSIGLFLLIALVFSYYIGKWCDGLFGTKPIFTVFWICCGVAASVLEAVRTIKKASQLDQSSGNKE